MSPAPGSFVLSLPGVVRAIKSTSAKEARLLDLHAPGGFVERRALAELRARGEAPDDAFYASHDVLDPECRRIRRPG